MNRVSRVVDIARHRSYIKDRESMINVSTSGQLSQGFEDQ